MKLNKKTISIFVVLILALTLFSIYLVNSSKTISSNETEENLVRSALTKYEVAAQNHDVDRLVELSLDLSWPNPEQFAKNIEGLNEKVYKFETVALEKVEEDLYHATVLVETASLNETKMEVPVLKLNGQWKIIVGQDLDDPNPSIKSSDFYKDYFTNLGR